MRKYGRGSFTEEILEECDISVADERESYWIIELNALDRDVGYNLILPTDHPSSHLDEAGRKHKADAISKKLKGRVIPEEQRRRISETLKQKYKDGELISRPPPHYDVTGRHHSEASRRKMSEARHGKTYEEIYGDHSEIIRGKASERWKGSGNPNYKDIDTQEIVSLIEDGLSNQDVAARLDISTTTVWQKLKLIGTTATEIRSRAKKVGNDE